MSASVDAERNYVAGFVADTVAATNAFAADTASLDTLMQMAAVITTSLRRGGKLMIAGNGGSAGDSQHIAGEFVARLMYDRAPLAAVAFTTDGSVMTAVGNDYGYEYVFERQMLALGREGDVFLGISTSGNSANVLRAFAAARTRGVAALGFSGGGGGKMGGTCDLLFVAPATQTALIQQVHIVAAHIVCALVERAMFPRP